MRMMKDLPNQHNFSFIGYSSNLTDIRCVVLFDGKTYGVYHAVNFSKMNFGSLIGWDYLNEF